MPWRHTQSLSPKYGGSIEDKIILWPRIDDSTPFTRRSLSFVVMPLDSLCHDFQSWYLRRISMYFPTDQSRYSITFFHIGPFKNPMIRISDGPISSSGNRLEIPHSHQQ